jgi:hypothetical protein
MRRPLLTLYAIPSVADRLNLQNPTEQTPKCGIGGFGSSPALGRSSYGSLPKLLPWRIVCFNKRYCYYNLFKQKRQVLLFEKPK